MKDYRKKVISHLRGDIKGYKKEAAEDRALIKKLDSKKGKKMKCSSCKKSMMKKAHHTKAGHKKGHAKFAKVMKEFKAGKLHSGSKKGPKVKSMRQARAIGFAEDRKASGTAKGGR